MSREHVCWRCPARRPSFARPPDPDDLAALIEDIAELRPAVDLLVVAMHWGISGSTALADYQRTVGHAAVDAGADLVLGAHPHVPQGIEVRTRPDRPTPGIICYSLGNFTFDWPAMGGRADGLLVRCLLDRDRRIPVHVSYVPVGRNDAGQPALLSPETPPGPRRGAGSDGSLTTARHLFPIRPGSERYGYLVRE